jgi:hypothetical protein
MVRAAVRAGDGQHGARVRIGAGGPSTTCDDGMQTGSAPEGRRQPAFGRAVSVTTADIGGNHGASSAVAGTYLIPDHTAFTPIVAVHY